MLSVGKSQITIEGVFAEIRYLFSSELLQILFRRFLRNSSDKILKSGRNVPVFTISTESSGFVKYMCTICTRVCNTKEVIGRKSIELIIIQHIGSNKHKKRLKAVDESTSFSAVSSRTTNINLPSPINNNSDSTLTTPTTEPARPVSLNSLIKQMDELLQLPLLGVEYLVVFADGFHHCFLCEHPSEEYKEVLPIIHLKSKNHQERFLSMHFPSVLDCINDIQMSASQVHLDFIDPKQVKHGLMREVCNAIRDRCGVLVPTFWKEKMAQADHERIAQSIENELRHFNEKDYPQIRDLLSEEFVQSMMIESVRKFFMAIKTAIPQTPLESVQIKQKPSVIIDNNKVPSTPASQNDDDLQQLSNTDFQLLLDNFDSLKPQEQQRLFVHIETFSPAKFVNLKKILTDKGSGHLEEALMRS
jgi:hypothetical protein